MLITHLNILFRHGGGVYGQSVLCEMDSLEVFMKEKYVANPDSRLPVKVIYRDFKEWIIGKYDMAMWNTIPQRKVYALLKQLHEYPYVRFKEGFCLKGIAYRKEEGSFGEGLVRETQVTQYLTLNILQGNMEDTAEAPGEVELSGMRQEKRESETVDTKGGVEAQLTMSEADLLRVQHACPRIQGVILPTLGQRTIRK